MKTYQLTEQYSFKSYIFSVSGVESPDPSTNTARTFGTCATFCEKPGRTMEIESKSLCRNPELVYITARYIDCFVTA